MNAAAGNSGTISGADTDSEAVRGSDTRTAGDAVHDITAGMLRDWPLPMPGTIADKEVRGHVLIVAGSREIHGGAGAAASV